MPAKVVLYVACSVDGYIAEKDGSIGFLEKGNQPQPDLEYEKFYDSIETIIMGGATYRQVAHELSPDKWIYEEKKSYVYTRSQEPAKEGIAFTSLPPHELLAKIKEETSGNIWVMGGGEIVKMFLKENLIDTFMVYQIPVLLGEGIPLFPEGFPGTELELESVGKVGSMAGLVFKKK